MGRILTSQRLQGDAGYFRIGNLVLSIPPEQIQCHKVINSNEVLPMRFPFALQIKTGQSRWDVTWTWKAIMDTSQDDPFSNWSDVQMLLAMFKAAPFVEVENDHIRQIVNPSLLTPGASDSDVMAFALRQMRVDTVGDMQDTLQISMTMSMFNYRPYSANFQYDDGTGKPTPSALTSPLFTSYLQTWIQNNLINDPTQLGLSSMVQSDTDWRAQVPGSVTLSCREYTAIALPRTLPTPSGQVPPTTGNPSTTQPGVATQSMQSGFVDNVFIQDLSPTNPQIQWWVAAAKLPESNGNYQAINFATKTNTGQSSVAVGILQWVRASAIEAMKGADKYLGTSYVSTAVQGGYLVASRGSSTGYSWSQKSFPNPKSANAQIACYISWMLTPPISGGASKLQNDMGTAWALLKLQPNNGSVLKAWEAHRFGQGIVNNGQGDPSKDNTWFTKAVNSWKSNPDQSQAFSPSQNNTPTPQPIPAPSDPALTSGTNTNTQVNLSNSTNPTGVVPMTDMIRYLIQVEGYTYDYATEAAAFLYKEHWLKMTSQDPNYGESPNCSDIPEINNDFFVHPNQISVVFVNNIAQLPLASYQYPTYQHMGPVSTLISIGMLSNAELDPATDIYSEPVHEGLSFISNMTSLMEDQFQRLRNEWRRVNSIHRMQSFVVKNQVLNMLGIRGLLTKELTTETIPETANMVNAQYNAIQYENVYEQEEPSPFRVTAVPQQIGAQWLTLLRNGTLNQFAGDASVNTLTNLSTLMQNPTSAGATKLLFQWLTAATPLPDYTAYLVPTPAVFQGTEQALMLKLIDESGGTSIGVNGEITQDFPSFTDTYPDIAAKIKSHSQLNYSDYFLIRNGASVNAPDYQNFQTIASQIDQRIQLALNANPGFEPPLNQLFDAYVDYAVTNNVQTLRDQMVRALNTPQLKPLFTTPDGAASPGSLQVNADHGCYVDMGINRVQLGGRDYTPAVYFYDDNAAITTTLQSQITQAVATTVKSAQTFATATPYATGDPSQKRITSSTTSFQGNVQGILSQVKPSSYTMARAFPTFKLFLMEDHSNRPFYAYDNFYSYATVLDMEIIRYRDKPDTAIIQISNLLHLLDQHLYDGTPQGRFEQRLRANVETQLSGSDALTNGGGASSAVNVNTAAGGEIYTLDNRFPEINPDGQGDQKFPLKYFALQTGTKIQIRMGFSNNPDLLTPVFTGQVTQIEGNEILTLTAQSYMLELITPTSDEINHDGFSVDGFINQTFNAVAKATRDIGNGNLLHVPSSLLSIFGSSAAYGGWGSVGGARIPGILTAGGTAKDVMSAMLKVSTAKHFGAWQFGAPTDKLIKGFSWQSAVASSLLLFGNSPLTAGATGLEAGYDRSFENILTTHIFGPDGTAKADVDGSGRGWWFEKPGGYGAPEYHVPKDNNLVPWTLIQDIARRYPEFILAVKQYGFPYTADATLVFANPHDFYSTRPPMPLEQETQQQAATDNTTFFQWWQSGTNSGEAQFTGFVNGLGGQWGNVVLKNYDKSINFTGDSAVSTLGKVGSALNALNPSSLLGNADIRNLTGAQLAAHITGGGASVFFNVVNMYATTIGGAISSIAFLGANALGHGVTPDQAQSALQQIVQNYYNFLNQKMTGTTNVAVSARMKPVRRWHLVNGDNIVHNGITLNEKFYNTVRIVNQQAKANSGIPPQYSRVLNADSFIVSPDNLKGYPTITNAYLQSFLRDEVSKMYRGELVLLGNPEIEPFDVLMLLDPSTGISGPVEVDSVIHSFNQEVGYITIVKPRGMVIINDKLSAPLYSAVWSMLSDMQGIIEGQASKLPFSISAPTVELGVSVLAGAGAIAAGPWIAGAAALGATVAIFWAGKEIQRLNPIGIAPLTRYERPWIAGLEGYSIDDLMGFLSQQWSYFKEAEIEPLIFSYRTAKGMGLI